ncbi:GTP cyclohydrolase I [Candidatus Nitrososphaera gargensis Ga9.2]|uniref:GTP cyclohydrolase 1 n=1 Tax=Nitrososphaera gargensis (strain Ga9.2) TaxID=1237085 RepID=K0IC10_NITGG|nr:GTP cyclohydrolase I FolE [Candidatus Nitrososphaera gargensis]AFU57090.1 GTP cyclohydrolase I [Candidatus Nitrososphaera gargensis Ga9.2]
MTTTAEKTAAINKRKIAKLVRELLIELGENPDREGLTGTPSRIADMYEEIFSGYRMDAELDVSFSEETDAVVAKDIQFYSMCEHHMLPFFGKIHVAYVPSGKVFGVSKLVRLVEKYSRRLQIQERLTKQIADELVRMGVKGALVIAEGEHLCMKMRGVRNDSSITTIAHRGIMEQKEVREHVLALIYNPKSEMTRV